MSNVKIDVLIPAIDKDLTVLPQVIDGIRKNVLHPIGDIYIVSPNSPRIKEMCKQKDCHFVLEDTILPVNKNNLYGAGWMLQQLLKLSCDKICSNDHFLIVDADTIFIAPHVFMYGEKTVFYCADFYWDCKPIFDHFKRLTRLKPVAHRSLINHSMFFSRTYLSELKNWIESIHAKPWYQAIIDTIDNKAYVPFSEYETYGNFMLIKHPENVFLARSKNLDRRIKDFQEFGTYDLDELAKRYNSISFHSRPGGQ
ncbi:DUF6492 family protein [Ammoniphilus sp. YIM 78166]|uniref:DUF6492 family protein n=1 Tax=Ammoniphilus sp. YIM 78166 TaxID=1644106 RepID=UPI00106F8F0E|nr:DUF6492 family protein [Ammoniphilus sp. YIM 78166]